MNRPRRRGWYKFYLLFIAVLLLVFAIAGFVLFKNVSSDTWKTIYNTYFDPDAAARA